MLTYDDYLDHERRDEQRALDVEAYNESLSDDEALDATFNFDADPLELEVELAFEAIQEPVGDESAVRLLEWSAYERGSRGL